MMKGLQQLPRVPLGVYPTPFYKLETVSRREGVNLWIKRDDLCGVALGGNKVRKLEFLLADARARGCDVVFTAGGAQSNHAMLTAACAARLNMQAILVLKKRGVSGHVGNLVLDDLFGAQVHFVDTDSYDDVYAETARMASELEAQGHKCYEIPVGGSTPLGSLGYAQCVREMAEQSAAASVRLDHIVSATGSGGTTAGLLLGSALYLNGTPVLGVGVDSDPFEEIVPRLARDAAALLDERPSIGPFSMRYHYGAGYAVPNPEDTPAILDLARSEGILLDPVYTGKAYAGMLRLLHEGFFGGVENIVFVHTGGAAALFAMDLG
ncbi:D-cysteine desulfhydrase family protein [Oscillibacter sp. MSJ-2]|uniref:D-cysteine desulfhydrase family protein n=1 Tax=Dysosmobacter acutus TaxID=2841504 RepID=A0ABS6F5I3_9FIRM|nr:D-cysteine desulfhydrase family protein [Dysosmobacter acutus]MBU5625333.1 D-cysteine desulfhydrase family protein [Dysosmobacter acutus]